MIAVLTDPTQAAENSRMKDVYPVVWMLVTSGFWVMMFISLYRHDVVVALASFVLGFAFLAAGHTRYVEEYKR